MGIVSSKGFLQARDGQIYDSNGEVAVLKGMSFFWSQWSGKFYNPRVVQTMVHEWNCSILRLPLGVDWGGYIENPRLEFEKICRVLDACIAEDVYAIVDWHDHEAQNHSSLALEFFTRIAELYPNQPHLILELYNEPLKVSWTSSIKPYCQKLTKDLRAQGVKNLIVAGTPQWSQDVDAAAEDPLEDENCAYTLHYYAGTHRNSLREKAKKALDLGVPLFVTEYGLSEASGNGVLDIEEARAWYEFMNAHNLSRCAWSICDKNESSAALQKGTQAQGPWTDADLSPCGKLLKKELLEGCL